MKIDTTVTLSNEQVIVVLDALQHYEGDHAKREQDAATYATLPALPESLRTAEGLRAMSEEIRGLVALPTARAGRTPRMNP